MRTVDEGTPPASETAAPATLRELRRAQVLAEARHIIARDGLEALTISALEARLSFSRGVISYHFENKEEIVLAVLAGVTERIGVATRARVRDSEHGPARIAAVVEGMTRGFLGHAESARILVSFWGRIHADPRLRAVNAALFDAFRADTLRLLREEVRAGTLDAAAASNEVAALVVGTVLGIVSQVYFAPDALDLDAVLAEAGALFAARVARKACTSTRPSASLRKIPRARPSGS